MSSFIMTVEAQTAVAPIYYCMYVKLCEHVNIMAMDSLEVAQGWHRLSGLDFAAENKTSNTDQGVFRTI